MTTEKTAIVFGASGLIGSHLVKELLSNPSYTKVVLVVRKPLVVVDPKAEEISLDNYESYELPEASPNDVHVFCCLGSTIKKAGSKEEFRRVDFELPVQVATWAKAKEIETFAIVSSIGAKSDSGSFYLKTKGEMEDNMKSMQFQRLFILRPSLLLGTRTEFRFGEEIAKGFSGILNLILFGPLKKYKAIDAAKVAKAMMILANSGKKDTIYESDVLEQIASE